MTTEEKRPPGRPRSDASHRAILAAAEDLLAEDGYANITIDGIAARAGVGKQTIYRWWPTKADVILEVSAGAAEFFVPTADHGSYAADLRAFLTTGFAMANRPHTADLLRGLMVEAQLREDFGQRFRADFLDPRRQAFASIAVRAASRGDLPATPSPDTVADIVFGTLWYRVLGTRQTLDDALVEELIQTLT